MTKPQTALEKVDFPAPLRPTRAIISPRPTVNESPDVGFCSWTTQGGCAYSATKAQEKEQTNNDNVSSNKDYKGSVDDGIPIAQNFCDDYKNGVRVVGYLIFIAKLFVPILIIAMGIADFLKTVTSNKPEDLKKQVNIFLVRLLAGVIIVFIPTIIRAFISLVDSNYMTDDYGICVTCLTDPGSCPD